MSVPRVKIQVALDKPRTLIISFNALCKAEEVTGQSFLVGDPAFSSMRVMRAMVWAGLLHEDPLLTIEQVGDMIEEAGAEVILGQIMLAYQAALPDPAKDGEEEEGDDEPSDPLSRQPGEIFGQPAGTISD